MKRLVTIAALGLIIGLPASARARPLTLESGLTRLNSAFNRLNQQLSSRVTLLERLKLYNATIQQTRARKAGPARDYRLRRLLAEARALSRRLSGLDVRIKRSQEELDRARKALLGLLARLKARQAAQVKAQLARTSRTGKRQVKVLKVAKTRIDPLDGPREIEEKADLLKDSEEKIRRRIREIARVIDRLKKRAKLRRISRRVDRDEGLYGEDTSRHRITRLRPGSNPNRSTPTDDGVTQDADTLGTNSGYATPAPGAAEPSWESGHSARTYAVLLKEVLSPAALASLRKASQSNDPEVRLKALQRVQQELRRAAARLRKKSTRYRQKARELRQKERSRRR